MTVAEFKQHVANSLDSLPPSVKDVSLPKDDRTLEALIHLNTSIHPHVKNNVHMLLQICQMEHGPDKLRAAMLWNFAVSQLSPSEVRTIIQSLDDYIRDSTSS
jgi:hypothetical protein